MAQQISIEIKEKQQSYQVISTIRGLAQTIGMNLTKQTQLCTAASELLTNILKYAGSGTMIISLEEDAMHKKITVRAVDSGPGIDDINLALTRGYSTKNTLGLGLPGAKRLSDEFKITSKTGVGTTVTISKWL